MIKLKPCPFCGGTPKLYGRERRDYVEDERAMLEGYVDENGWALKTAKEFWVQPFCRLGCLLGGTYSHAFGIVGGPKYITPEAAAKAWNKRFRKAKDERK